MSAGWDDPDYVAAKKARAEAYAEFCTVAAANPHRDGGPEFMAYYETNVAPVKEAWIAAQRTFNAESARIVRSMQ
jgi:hypothetical protein